MMDIQSISFLFLHSTTMTELRTEVETTKFDLSNIVILDGWNCRYAYYLPGPVVGVTTRSATHCSNGQSQLWHCLHQKGPFAIKLRFRPRNPVQFDKRCCS